MKIKKQSKTNKKAVFFVEIHNATQTSTFQHCIKPFRKYSLNLQFIYLYALLT